MEHRPMETMGGVFIYNDKRYEKEISKWQRIKPSSLLTRNSPKFLEDSRTRLCYRVYFFNFCAVSYWNFFPCYVLLFCNDGQTQISRKYYSI